jgi:hypothetical protein
VTGVAPAPPDRRGLVPLLVGDGRPLLTATGLALLLAGLFALFLSARKEFLPHDVAFLGMTPERLCQVNECRVVHFMIHDRVAFGGALCAIGVVYLWLAAGPVAAGERWAWWLLATSGAQGFLSFLAYLGYGYLDTWHGAATLGLLGVFAAGLARTWRRVNWRPPRPIPRLRDRRRDPGRVSLIACAGGMVGGGLTILTVGMTTVFVPEDVAYLGVGRTELDAINPRLVPLIAHDRAGFGGAVCCCGILLGGVAWFAEVTRALWQALVAAGAVGFGTAVFVHPAIGYTDGWHLTPAVTGAALYAAGLCFLSALSAMSVR